MKKAIIIQREDLASYIYSQKQIDQIGEFVDLLAPPLAPEIALQSESVLKDAEVIFTTWGMFPLDEATLEMLPNLKIVFYAAGSVKGFVTESSWERGIRVCSAQSANAVPVAEWSLATILLSLKSHFRHAATLKDRKVWHPESRYVMHGAYGTKVGLLSVGAIARKLIDLLKPFDVEILASCPFLTVEEAQKLGVQLVDMETLFRESDVVSMHTALVEETVGMVTGDHLRLMKPFSTLINSSRGPVIRHDELVEVLGERDDLWAVLDVFDPEPLPDGHPLFDLPNVTMTPHISGSMQHECHRMADYMISECKRYLEGLPLKYEVNPEQLSRMA